MIRLRQSGKGNAVAAWLLVAVAISLAACKKQSTAETPEVRPVRTVVATPETSAETIVLTGHIAAENEASLGFRIAGRVVERLVSVGDKVETGQVLAKLDPQDELNVLRSTNANLAAAQAQQRNASATFDRQRELLAAGHTPRAQFDQALRELKVAEARVDEVAAQVKNQALRVAWTSLQADAPGTISAVGSEAGEVVQAGQMIVRVARSGGRDAVFDMPARLIREAPPDVPIMVRLSDDPSVLAEGRVREVAAQADPATRTFEVKVGLTVPPPAMRLGSSVTGSLQLASDPAIMLPASALTSSSGQPAVWIVDPASLTVSLRNVEFGRFDPDTVLIARGVETGDIIVTAGVHALHPGQKVRLLERAS